MSMPEPSPIAPLGDVAGKIVNSLGKPLSHLSPNIAGLAIAEIILGLVFASVDLIHSACHITGQFPTTAAWWAFTSAVLSWVLYSLVVESLYTAFDLRMKYAKASSA
jgi:hypothetical protein